MSKFNPTENYPTPYYLLAYLRANHAALLANPTGDAVWLTPEQKIIESARQITEVESIIIEEVIARHDDKVKPRARMEAAIALRLLEALRAAGYGLAVDDGDEDVAVPTNKEAMELLFNLDEARIICTKEGTRSSFVLLVFGNNGWDLISDYGMSLESVIEPVQDWAEEQFCK